MKKITMEAFKIVLLILLVVLALSVFFIKKLQAVIVFMSFSLIMAILWVLLEAPDLAITEAAVGAGGTTILFFLTLKKIIDIDKEYDKYSKENKIPKEELDREEEKNYDE